MNPFIQFLKDRITDKMPLEKIVDVFEQMCSMPLENDVILFETGTFSTFSPEPLFQISLVRQYPNEENDEYFQICVNVLY